MTPITEKQLAALACAVLAFVACEPLIGAVPDASEVSHIIFAFHAVG